MRTLKLPAKDTSELPSIYLLWTSSSYVSFWPPLLRGCWRKQVICCFLFLVLLSLSGFSLPGSDHWSVLCFQKQDAVCRSLRTHEITLLQKQSLIGIGCWVFLLSVILVIIIITLHYRFFLSVCSRYLRNYDFYLFLIWFWFINYNWFSYAHRLLPTGRIWPRLCELIKRSTQHPLKEMILANN